MTGKKESFSRESVRGHWESCASTPEDADGLKPTARDPYLQTVVENAILRHLDSGMRMVDIGCGEGASTYRFGTNVTEAVGVDYIKGFVDTAQKNNQSTNVSFMQADVLNLSEVRAKHGQFDVATSIRCLINLVSADDQARALEQIASLVRPGGLYLASEGWEDGFQGLNLRRERSGLGAMNVAEYNLLLDRARFERDAGEYFELIGYEPLGLYLFLSRVVQPVMESPDPPSHTHPLNAVAATLQTSLGVDSDFSDCDYAGVYVFRRKSDN